MPMDFRVNPGPLDDLPQKGLVMAEYVWIGASGTSGGFDLRCKTKTLPRKPASIADLPIWNYDGSSTGQAPGDISEVLLRPQAIFNDPFRRGDNILALCDAIMPRANEPIPTNTRAAAAAAFAQKPENQPWYGIEQETVHCLGAKVRWGRASPRTSSSIHLQRPSAHTRRRVRRATSSLP